MKKIHYANGNVELGEIYEGKWHGYSEDIDADGHKRSGNWINGNPFGEFKFLLSDRSSKIKNFKD